MRARRMFGGWGLYAGELFIALIAKDQLYLKVNAVTQPRFESAGGQAFVYSANGKTAAMGYYAPPAEAMESPALMQPWAALAVQAALAARSARQTTQALSTAARGRPRP